jgi:CrcB protein
MRNALIVGAGGFLGAIARHGVNLALARLWTGPFPLGTFLINVSGSFALGLVGSFAAERLELDPAWRLLVGTGFLGAYTTFSTFEFETHRLVQAGAWAWAALNVVASLAAGLLAVRLGAMAGR